MANKILTELNREKLTITIRNVLAQKPPLIHVDFHGFSNSDVQGETVM